MADKFDCTACRKQVTATKNNRYRTHTDGSGERCEMSSVEIPGHLLDQPVGKDDAPDVPREGVDYALCIKCGRNVKLTRLGYFEPHATTLKGADRCEASGTRASHRRTETVPLPGDKPLPASAAVPRVATAVPVTGTEGTSVPPHEVNLARDPMPSPASTTTSAPSPKSSSAGTAATSSDASGSPGEPASAGSDRQALLLAPLLGDGSILQPFSNIFQPFPVPEKIKLKDALTADAQERVTRFKEIFFSYNNRRSSDNRSAQTTLGPSEIGHECDRRLAMSLLGVEPVNPGGDGWAAWLGTQGHRGLEEIFTWASANSGRFATELRLRFDSKYVPKGTTDILDRQTAEVGDFKFMGEYSLKKLIQEGPPPHYRTQLQVYGLGVEEMGEKVRSVALYGLPRAAASLDGMYVWTAPYSRKEARDALDRVDRIAQQAEARTGPGTPRNPLEVARSFEAVPECRFCPFYLKNDKEMMRGCPGL